MGKHKSRTGGLTKATERSITERRALTSRRHSQVAAQKEIVLRQNERRKRSHEKKREAYTWLLPLESGSANESGKGQKTKNFTVSNKTMTVDPPKGYHWMEEGGRYYLMAGRLQTASWSCSQG